MIKIPFLRNADNEPWDDVEQYLVTNLTYDNHPPWQLSGRGRYMVVEADEKTEFYLALKYGVTDD